MFHKSQGNQRTENEGHRSERAGRKDKRLQMALVCMPQSRACYTQTQLPPLQTSVSFIVKLQHEEERTEPWSSV